MDEHVMRTYVRAEPVFVGGCGARLVDDEGNEHLDLLGGIAVSALGHAHPGLVQALRDQAGQVLHVSNLYRHPHTERVAGLLAEFTGLEAVFFSNSGAEANECALKLARAHQKRNGAPERTAILAFEGGFHGRTLGTISVTEKEAYRAPFEPLLPGVHFLAPDDAAAFDAAIDAHHPAAVILEPIQGEGGIRSMGGDFLRHVREACTATGTVLIHDEVQSGCGRTGSFLAGARAGVTPDVVTLAKPLGAGLPIGATVASAAFASTLVPGDHGSTFGGGPMALRAAGVFLEAWAEGELKANVEARAAQLERGLDELVSRHAHVRERRGAGLMQGIAMETPAQELVDALHRRRVLTCGAGENVVRFLPPFVITESDLAEGLAHLQDALLETAPAN